MSEEATKAIWTKRDYYINLPYDEALALKEQIEARVWEIAREEKDDETGKSVEEILQDAGFQVEVGKPALVDPTLIHLIVGWAIQGAVTGGAGFIAQSMLKASVDKIGKIWNEKIWPTIQDEYNNALQEEHE